MSDDDPITRAEAIELRDRLRKLEDYFFAFKILSSAVVAVAIFLGWVAQNWNELKNMILGLMGVK